MKCFAKTTLILVVLTLSSSYAHAEERSFASGSLIIPMDLSYQNDGVYQAYGLLYELLRQGGRYADMYATWIRHAKPTA